MFAISLVPDIKTKVWTTEDSISPGHSFVSISVYINQRGLTIGINKNRFVYIIHNHMFQVPLL